MSYSKSIQLSITDLEEAKKLAAGINQSISQKQVEVFSAGDLKVTSNLAENGTYEYRFQNECFQAEANLVVGWDMQHVNGENKKFMALNFKNKFGNKQFQDLLPEIKKLPDKGYFGGMLIGGFLSFAGCMGYAYYTEALDVFFFFIVILVVGWLSSKVGSILGEKKYSSRFDDLTEKALVDSNYLNLAESMVEFNKAVESILDRALEEDQRWTA